LIAFARARTAQGVLAAHAVMLLLAGHGPAAAASGEWPAAVASALEQADGNRPALEAALAHYRDAGDSLGLRAAQYLVANIAGQAYVRFGLFDSSGATVDFDVLAYPDYEALVASFDSLEALHGVLHYERIALDLDIHTLPASLLIENVDCALRAWRERPWAPGLPFEIFCAYVLPYRGSNEPLESWRPHFLHRYADLPDTMRDPRDPLEAARLINRDLMSWFRFDPRFYHHPTDQGLSEMLANRIGRCEDMTNLTIYAMRANALPVTSDYTPFWADANNNHAWNAILDAQGNATIFMGAEAQPGEYALANRAAKVYRKTFAHQPGNLAFRKTEDEKVPPWLAGKNYLDVTAFYGPVSDVTVVLDPPVPDTARFAYLCVFNTGEWQPIHWAAIAAGRAVFTAMGRGVAYLPAYYHDEKVAPAAPAFILDESGEVHPLLARPEHSVRLSLISTTRLRRVESTDGVHATALSPGQSYDLYYWSDRWVLAGQATAGPEPLRFDAPSGALYWLVEKDGRKEERIFSYAGGSQVWW